MIFKCVHKERLNYDNKYKFFFIQVAELYQSNENHLVLISEFENEFFINEKYKLSMKEVK